MLTLFSLLLLPRSLRSIDEQWSKVCTFISLLYAKALNINEENSPVLYWKQRNGLLGKQFELANAIDLITEANALSQLEYGHYKRIGRDSLSSKLYFKSLDIVRQLNNERIYLDLKQSINGFHSGLHKWTTFEENFFSNDRPKARLTFDTYSDYVNNYSDYMLLNNDQNQLIRNWECHVQSTYANVLGYACASMALLGDHNFNTWKSSFDFGSNFAFNWIVSQQFASYFDGPDGEAIALQLPVLMHLKLSKDEQRDRLIETMLSRRHCSLTALRLKSEVRNDDTLKQIRIYGQSYLNQSTSCLEKLADSDSKQALLQISNSLLEMNGR